MDLAESAGFSVVDGAWPARIGQVITLPARGSTEARHMALTRLMASAIAEWSGADDVSADAVELELSRAVSSAGLWPEECGPPLATGRA